MLFRCISHNNGETLKVILDKKNYDLLWVVGYSVGIFSVHLWSLMMYSYCILQYHWVRSWYGFVQFTKCNGSVPFVFTLWFLYKFGHRLRPCFLLREISFYSYIYIGLKFVLGNCMLMPDPETNASTAIYERQVTKLSLVVVHCYLYSSI